MSDAFSNMLSKVTVGSLQRALRIAEQASRSWARVALELRDMHIKRTQDFKALPDYERTYFDAAMSIPFHGCETDECIVVWPFEQAPDYYRKLSTHGGDEDWLARIPKKLYDKHGLPLWMDSGSSFGCCGTSEHPQADGSVIAIGAHA